MALCPPFRRFAVGSISRAALGYSCAGTVVESGWKVLPILVSETELPVLALVTQFTRNSPACPDCSWRKFHSSSNVIFENAAFTTVGAVAMHGIRTAEAKLGEIVAVIGLGIARTAHSADAESGWLSRAGNGYQSRARRTGSTNGCGWRKPLPANEFRDLCLSQSGGNGADIVLITAETASSDPVNLASEVARDRGIVVAVGTVGMDIQRKLYYEKELDFRVSRSYGPGRYDSAYEQKGRDYPIGYVRWTETRNMEAFIQLLATRQAGSEIAWSLIAFQLNRPSEPTS